MTEKFVEGTPRGLRRPTIEFILPEVRTTRRTEDGGTVHGVTLNKKILMPVDDLADPRWLINTIESREKAVGMKYVTHYGFPDTPPPGDSIAKRRVDNYQLLSAYLNGKPKYEEPKEEPKKEEVSDVLDKAAGQSAKEQSGAVESPKGRQGRPRKSNVPARAKAGETAQL